MRGPLKNWHNLHLNTCGKINLAKTVETGQEAFPELQQCAVKH